MSTRMVLRSSKQTIPTLPPGWKTIMAWSSNASEPSTFIISPEGKRFKNPLEVKIYLSKKKKKVNTELNSEFSNTKKKKRSLLQKVLLNNAIKMLTT